MINIKDEFKKMRSQYLMAVACSDKRASIDTEPNNYMSTAVYLNIMLEKYIKATDKSPVTRLGDSLEKYNEG